MTDIGSVSVFCGASLGASPRYESAARDLGGRLAKAGIGLVYGGGKVGLMGQVADAALSAGGRVVGVIPSFLDERERGHPGLTELHVVSSMHERKRLMFDLSQAACALPGGLGTLDEIIELVTWHQLGLHARPMVIINTDGYWDPLRGLTEHVVANAFAAPAARDLFTYVPSPEAALEVLSRAASPPRSEAAARL